MFSRILRRIPFIHHQPPLNMPLRKAIIWSLQRPVNLKQIEVNLLGHLRKNEQIALDELKSSIAYLRKKRFYKRDSSNLFVAGVRAACEHDAALGIEFGKSMIGEIPDIRAIRTLVTYLNRTRRFEEIPAILHHLASVLCYCMDSSRLLRARSLHSWYKEVWNPTPQLHSCRMGI